MSQRAERDNKILPAESRQTFLVKELLLLCYFARFFFLVDFTALASLS